MSASILCKFRGMLVFIEAQPAKDGKGSCPDCGGTEFEHGTSWDKGWTVCRNCGFAALTAHIERARHERQTVA